MYRRFIKFAKKQETVNRLLFLVRETGLEPVRCNHTPLKRARLPVPPLSHICHLRNIDIILQKIWIVNSFFEKN